MNEITEMQNLQLASPTPRVQAGLIVEVTPPNPNLHLRGTAVSPVVPFIIKPYLQLGDNEAPSQFGQLELAWHTAKIAGDWRVEIRAEAEANWHDCGSVQTRRLKIEDAESHLRHTCLLQPLTNNRVYEYRLLWQKAVTFQAKFRSPVSEKDPYRVVVVGDIADGNAASRAIINGIYNADPDLTVIAGDIVYKRGKFSEYMRNFFPVFNCDDASADCGAPLMRSYLLTAAVGNHDVTVPPKERDRSDAEEPEKKKGKKKVRRSQLFAYEIFWKHPDNGPHNLHRDLLRLDGESAKFERIFQEFGTAVLSKTNFSYSYGNSFWIHLDGNEYMDWSEPTLRHWLNNQLAEAQDFTWKFVVIHQPPFTSDVAYWQDQKNRLLCELFEAGQVDIVFSGHCHIYERTYPLSFTALAQPDGGFLTREGMVDGRLRLDKEFDGDKNRRPRGVIYITTGAGGHELGPEHRPDLKVRHPFTDNIDIDNFSISILDIDGGKLKFEQLTTDGKVLDRLAIEK